MQPSFVRTALMGLALLLVACSPLQVSAPLASVEQAARLAASGDHAAAATMYSALSATNPPPLGLQLSLSAARQWLAAGKADVALSTLPPPGTGYTPALLLERGLLETTVHLARDKPADAWKVIATLAAPATDALPYWQLRQRTAFAAGRPVDAVRAALTAEPLLVNDAERTAQRSALLGALRQSAERGTKFTAPPANEPVIRGWLDLGTLAATAARSPLSAARELAAWRKRYPSHPGSSIYMAELTTGGGPAPALAALANVPVAVLLPLGGRNGAAAALVRDGLQGALSQLPESQRPQLRIHDTSTMSVAEAVAKSQADGAGLIIGPLTRDEAVAAVAANTRGTPMLLLNSLPAGQVAPANVWQYSLSPEDEARQIARHALAQGHKRAILITPTGDWGTRVAAAFNSELLAGGGKLLAQATYDPQGAEFTAQITAALRIDESRARHKRVQDLVGGKLNFESRRRADVDFIFAAGQSLALRQIRPQLRFFYAGDVPTYMTSDGYEPNPQANRDIDGMLFPDMPWLLQESGPVADTRTATQAAWGGPTATPPRLYAFGYDAGQLALALRDPRWQWPLAGVTGRLAPEADRRIRRELDWAQLRSGKPVLLSAPPLIP